MKSTIPILAIALLLCSCNSSKDDIVTEKNAIEGAWQLVSGTIIQQSDTTVTDYTKGQKMVKIITPTHFSFFLHDLQAGKDSTAAVYSSGSGTYTLTGDQYTENLEFCSAREWEGKSFHFTVTVEGDTLIQRGHEKVEETGVDRDIIEKYTRVK